MINLWLDLGPAGIILVPFAVCYATAAGIVWLTHRSRARPFFASCIGIVGPFFGSVAILYALFAVFLASDVWNHHEQAQIAVAREAGGVSTMLRMADEIGDAGNPLKEATVAYANKVIAEEWPAMRRGARTEPALLALRELGLATVAPAFVQAAPPAVNQAVVEAYVEIRQARRDRLFLSAGHGTSLNWLGMVMMGIFTQVAVAVVHLDKMRPQALALFVFTTAFAASVGLTGLHERPFSSGVAVDDLPLRVAISPLTP